MYSEIFFNYGQYQQILNTFLLTVCQINIFREKKNYQQDKLPRDGINLSGHASVLLNKL